MPLNDDQDDALTDEDYAALIDEMQARAELQGEPPCRMAVPADVLTEALERLDAQEDYRG